MIADEVLAGLLTEIEESLEQPSEDAPPREAMEALAADLRAIGFFGLLTVIADSPAPAEEIHADHLAPITARLWEGLHDEGAEADPAAAPPLPALLERYVEAKGDKGPALARKAIENALFEHYELTEHGLFVDDVAKALDCIRASTAPHDDIKELIRAFTRLSSETAKFILGLFPEQIDLIYRISQRQAMPAEIERVFEGFGPGAIRKRLFAVTKTLIGKEKRLRLALSLWARASGVAITLEQMLDLEKHLAVISTEDLLKRLLERDEARRALIAFRAEHPAIEALERHL